MISRKLALVAFLVTLSAQGAEIAWIHGFIQHEYRDLDKFCKSADPGGNLYISMEMEDGQPAKVVLSNHVNKGSFTYIYRSRALSRSEMESLEVFNDSSGRVWLKRLFLSEATVRWVMYHSSRSFSYCELPQPLATISPGPVTFDFETEGISEGVLRSYSQKVAFEGTRLDGRAFNANLRLMQTKFTH